MRPLSLSLFLLLLLCPALLRAEPTPAPTTRDLQAQIDALQQRLAESEAARSELLTAEADETSGLNAQTQRLRQENQRLRLQLKTAQADGPPPLLSEKQLWYLIGAATSLLSLLIGALLRSGGRKAQRQWFN